MTYRRNREQQSESSSGFDLLTIGLVVLCGYLFFANISNQSQVGPAPKPDPDGQVIDDKTPTSLPKGFVILIHQRQPMSADDVSIIRELGILRDANPGFDYRSVDTIDTNQKVVARLEWAAKKGVKPPLALWENESGEPVKAIPMPKGIEGLRKVWK
jgi:hypothetical protein